MNRLTIRYANGESDSSPPSTTWFARNQEIDKFNFNNNLVQCQRLLAPAAGYAPTPSVSKTGTLLLRQTGIQAELTYLQEGGMSQPNYETRYIPTAMFAHNYYFSLGLEPCVVPAPLCGL